MTVAGCRHRTGLAPSRADRDVGRLAGFCGQLAVSSKRTQRDKGDRYGESSEVCLMLPPGDGRAHPGRDWLARGPCRHRDHGPAA